MREIKSNIRRWIKTNTLIQDKHTNEKRVDEGTQQEIRDKGKGNKNEFQEQINKEFERKIPRTDEIKNTLQRCCGSRIYRE